MVLGPASASLSAQAIEQVSPDWYVAEIGSGVTPVFDFGADDDLHLLWHADESQQENGPVTYAHAASLSGPWAKQVLTSGYFYGPGDLIVAKDGRTHLLFHDHIGAPRHFGAANR